MKEVEEQTIRLVEVLKEGSDSERMAAARTLGEQKAHNTGPALVEALNDPDQYVRGYAAWALGEVGDPSATGPLVKALVKYGQISKTDQLRQESKCLTDISLALETLTGHKFGLDVEKWQQWYQTKAERGKGGAL
jgi:hypothetical protein